MNSVNPLIRRCLFGLLFLLCVCDRSGTACESSPQYYCKDDLPVRESRCEPTLDVPFEELPADQCARTKDDDGEELLVDGKCHWIVCVESDLLDDKCHPIEGQKPDVGERLMEKHFEWLNREDNRDYGFSVTSVHPWTCVPTRKTDNQCCYAVGIKEDCHNLENADK